MLSTPENEFSEILAAKALSAATRTLKHNASLNRRFVERVPAVFHHPTPAWGDSGPEEVASRRPQVYFYSNREVVLTTQK